MGDVLPVLPRFSTIRRTPQMDFDFAPIGAAISARLRVRQHGALRCDNNPWDTVPGDPTETRRKDLRLLKLGLCCAQRRQQRDQGGREEDWKHNGERGYSQVYNGADAVAFHDGFSSGMILLGLRELADSWSELVAGMMGAPV
jgi:hypothetical protein